MTKSETPLVHIPRFDPTPEERDWLKSVRAARNVLAARNAALDTLNATLEACERALVRLRLGVSVGVPLDEKNTLVWSKQGKRWLFTIGGQLLANAPYALRVRAVEVLPAVMEALSLAVEAELTAVQTATQNAEEILSVLEKK